ncbi:MAG TPA: hypothetical protein VIX12_03710 [Candidatus Binataceae bacterium]
MSGRLFVGNLNFSVGDDALREMFTQVGAVACAEVVRDRFDGRSRGFGFVEMNSEEEAVSAIGELNGAELAGRPMRVEAAVSRREGERRSAAH